MTKRVFYVALICAACLATIAVADECCHRCERCGCSAECCKVCRCVPDVKKVTKTTYSCECEDFCVPGPSQHCVTCDECGKKQHNFTPSGATMRTRKKLVKHETTSEVKTYKWVVENVCPHCAAREQADAASAEMARGPATGGEGQQVTYRTLEPAEAVAGSDVKSQIRRLFAPDLPPGQSGR